MYDEDQETLAAEYVLGTLSAEERTHAEALRTFDPGFEASVRQWERRLGELNVMVEAVEPPPELWDKIESEVKAAEPAGEIALAPEKESLSSVAGLASDIAIPEAAPESSPRPETAAVTPSAAAATAEPSAPEAKKIERGADVIYLAARVRRWRRTSFGLLGLAALLALYIAVWQVAPDLVPPQLRPPAAKILAQPQAPAPAQQDRLVAVLQQGPTSPAFLVTFDMQNRMLFVRRVSATPESGKSYELWLISNRFSAPRSLGTVGDSEFSARTLPESYDLETLRAASYAVSLEPAGGSSSGAPTGPILFTGKAVEALPPSPTRKT